MKLKNIKRNNKISKYQKNKKKESTKRKHAEALNENPAFGFDGRAAGRSWALMKEPHALSLCNLSSPKLYIYIYIYIYIYVYIRI